MYVVLRWWGETEDELPPERFLEVIDELSAADAEHSSVSLKHESEWDLSYGKSGTVIFENVEEREAKPRHMSGVSPSTVVELWTRLAHGDLEWLERQPWKSGYGS